MEDEFRKYLVEGPSGIWRYYRRVPLEIVESLGKKHEKISLKTKDYELAVEKAQQVHSQIVENWRKVSWSIHRVTQTAKPLTDWEEYQAVVKAAEAQGLTYKPMAEMLTSESDEKIEYRTFAALAGARGDPLPPKWEG